MWYISYSEIESILSLGEKKVFQFNSPWISNTTDPYVPNNYGRGFSWTWINQFFSTPEGIVKNILSSLIGEPGDCAPGALSDHAAHRRPREHTNHWTPSGHSLTYPSLLLQLYYINRRLSLIRVLKVLLSVYPSKEARTLISEKLLCSTVIIG